MDKLKDYIDAFLSDDVVSKVNEVKQWNALEDILGHIFFGLANFFAPHEYDTFPCPHNGSNDFALSIPSTTRPNISTQYLAVNFRGLYRRNGRETIIATYNKFRSKYPKLESHIKLHSIYMENLSRKTESINHLFLASTILPALSIHFTNNKNSSINLDQICSIKIGQDILQALNDFLNQWQSKVALFLSDNLDESTFRNNLTNTREKIKITIRQVTLNFLGSHFFDEWRNKIPHKPSPVNAIDAVKRFENWLFSICWLAFYVNKQHAGKFFYSLRLPSLMNLNGHDHKAIFPDSSLSLVTLLKLPHDAVNLMNGFSGVLHANNNFIKILKHTKKIFDDFKNERRRSQSSYNRAAIRENILANFIAEHGKNISSLINGKVREEALPVDFTKLVFLLNMSRLLVGKQHEGVPLHFCFIFGFSWERIDSESKGTLKEVISNLCDQWYQFIKSVLKNNNSEPNIADGMSRWIKNADLLLQPWDMALFFEEAEGSTWPVPTSAVRVSNRVSQINESVATEFQLRQALKHLTAESLPTAAILVHQNGLILYVLGKQILIPCNSDTIYSESYIDIRLFHDPTDQQFKADEDIFNEFLNDVLSENIFTNTIQRGNACELITNLCEALVTHGHGAMIILGSENQRSALKPLNPVWVVEPNINGPGLKEGILLYALMSAMDGATEIYLSDKDAGLISIATRKSANNNDVDIWQYNENGEVVLSARFDHTIALGLVGKGTRHHSALALSSQLGKKAIVLTVSADLPISLWEDGKKRKPRPQYPEPTFKP